MTAPQCEHIEEGLMLPFWRLKLPGLLEARYGRDGFAAMMTHMLRAGWFAVVAVNGFLVADWLMAHDVFWFSVMIRLGVFTPVVVCILLMARPMLPWFRPKAAAHVLSCAAMLISWGVAVCLYLILQRTQSPWGVFYYAGFMVVIVYGNLVQQQFSYAVVFTMVIMLLAVVGIFSDPDYPPALRISLLNLLAATAGFTLMASHVAEKARRRRYLLMLRDHELVQDLSEINERLHQISRKDALTGLANRRSLHEGLSEIWATCMAQHQPVSLLMMDVDHFKNYNDRHGHPAGDQCLKWVAATMAEVLAAWPGALVARFGGEEFVAVLPDASPLKALRAGESVRAAVESLRLRHLQSGLEEVVTLSVGAATLMPGLPDAVAGPDKLISSADRALYDAKRDGRNRVVFYQEPMALERPDQTG